MQRSAAIILAVCGFALGASGYLVMGICTRAYASICIDYGYYVPGAGLLVFGLVLGGLGAAQLLRTPEFPSHVPRLFCDVCGDALLMVPRSAQWYCPRCGQYKYGPSAALEHHDA